MFIKNIFIKSFYNNINEVSHKNGNDRNLMRMNIGGMMGITKCPDTLWK